MEITAINFTLLNYHCLKKGIYKSLSILQNKLNNNILVLKDCLTHNLVLQVIALESIS